MRSKRNYIVQEVCISSRLDAIRRQVIYRGAGQQVPGSQRSDTGTLPGLHLGVPQGRIAALKQAETAPRLEKITEEGGRERVRERSWTAAVLLQKRVDAFLMLLLLVLFLWG